VIKEVIKLTIRRVLVEGTKMIGIEGHEVSRLQEYFYGSSRRAVEIVTYDIKKRRGANSTLKMFGRTFTIRFSETGYMTDEGYKDVMQIVDNSSNDIYMTTVDYKVRSMNRMTFIKSVGYELYSNIFGQAPKRGKPFKDSPDDKTKFYICQSARGRLRISNKYPGQMDPGKLADCADIARVKEFKKRRGKDSYSKDTMAIVRQEEGGGYDFELIEDELEERATRNWD